jgi:hypothetical protein
MARVCHFGASRWWAPVQDRLKFDQLSADTESMELTAEDQQIIDSLDVRITEVASEVEPGKREIRVSVYAAGHDLFGSDNPMLAQLSWEDPAGQISDDLTNNGEIDDETLIRALGVEGPDGSDEAAEAAFESRREHVENVVCEHVLAAVKTWLAER